MNRLKQKECHIVNNKINETWANLFKGQYHKRKISTLLTIAPWHDNDVPWHAADTLHKSHCKAMHCFSCRRRHQQQKPKTVRFKHVKNNDQKKNNSCYTLALFIIVINFISPIHFKLLSGRSVGWLVGRRLICL